MPTERFQALRRVWTVVAGDSPVPHRPTFRASALAALLAVGVVLGFVATRAVDHSASGQLVPGSSTSAPSTTTTSPHVAPTTTPPTTTTTAPPVTTTTEAVSANGTCTSADVRISVSVSGSGGNVDVTSVLTDEVRCSFFPVAGTSGCPTYVSATDNAGNQVWPTPGQGEVCSRPSAIVLTPGQTESVSAVWSGARPGNYVALGTWTWSAGSGQAPVQDSGSTPFRVF